MIIDTHQHYWNYNPVEFSWIDDEMAKIRQSFLPNDLKKTLKNTGVEGVVTVQARQSMEETDWLLKLADENDFMRGVVGWLPLVAENIEEILDKYNQKNKLKALRASGEILLRLKYVGFYDKIMGTKGTGNYGLAKC